MRPSWIKIAIVFAGLWLLVGASVIWVRGRKPTAERVVAFVSANPLDGRPSPERRKIIEAVASRVNRIEFEDRREMDRQRKMEPFWASLTPDERMHYLDLVMPQGFKQMMENFNKMEPAKRKRLVRRAVEEMRSHGDDQPRRDVSEAQMRKIVDQGLKTFYSDATIEAKMDALPFLEQLEQTIKWGR